MTFLRPAVTLLILLTLFVTGCASLGKGSSEEKRQSILAMKDQALTKLFKAKPDTRAQVQAAAGYAVFPNANINLLVVAAGTGYGVAKNNRTAKHVYMNMAEAGVGLGAGVKDYRIVMIFHTEKALNKFIESGWTFGGNADASAKAGGKGASIEGEVYYGDVSVYTFTESGLALQAIIKGTKFWQDNKLNQR